MTAYMLYFLRYNNCKFDLGYRYKYKCIIFMYYIRLRICVGSDGKAVQKETIRLIAFFIVLIMSILLFIKN